MKKKDLISKPIVDLALARSFPHDLDNFIHMWNIVKNWNNITVPIPHSATLSKFSGSLISGYLRTSDAKIAASEKHGVIVHSKEFPNFVLVQHPSYDSLLTVYVRCKDCAYEDYIDAYHAVEDDEAGIYISCPRCSFLNKDYIV